MKGEIQSIALSICQTCLRHNIQLEMELIPRSKNERADKLSRIVDKDDWFDSDEFFQYFDALWNPHIVDRFASYLVTITLKFQDSILEFGIQVVMHFSWIGRRDQLGCPTHFDYSQSNSSHVTYKSGGHVDLPRLVFSGHFGHCSSQMVIIL